MLGIADPGIYLGYLFAILSLLACVVYGIKNWNEGIERDEKEIEKDLQWEAEDEQINEQL